MKSYGKELILDLHNCDVSRFNRHGITMYFIQLCKLIEMEREDLHFWDYEGDPDGYKNAPLHLKGISAIQFISTSNITIHTLDVLKKIYLNIFSCKEFDPDVAKDFTEKTFKGRTVNNGGKGIVIYRK